jgi:hypothetical protein
MEATMGKGNQSGGQGQARIDIDINDDAGVQGWARKLDATPQQIRDAVAAVGNLAADVEMYLKGTHSTSNADAQAGARGARP